MTSRVAYDRLVTVFSRPFAIVFLLHPYDNQNPQSSWLVSDFSGRIYQYARWSHDQARNDPLKMLLPLHAPQRLQRRTVARVRLREKGGRKVPRYIRRPGNFRSTSWNFLHQTNIAASAFMAKALPISANFTNTPPSVADDESVPAASADPGFIGGVKCLPSQFSTGSYGWKGNRRVSIEVRNEAGEMEKVIYLLKILNRDLTLN